MNLKLLGLVIATTLSIGFSQDIPWQSWSSNNGKSLFDLNTAETQDYSELVKSQNATTTNEGRQSSPSAQYTDQDVDEFIESILASGRQGRNLDGLDDVYSDPSIQNALNSGDDAEARNLIKDKLCSLGLMQCDDPQGKRPYFSPDDLIYAQPIAIRPVGRPIPSVPVRGGQQKLPPPPTHRGPYGPPKPMPIPNSQNFKKVGYASSQPGFGPPSGSYPGPSGPFAGPPGSYSGSSSGSYSGGPPGSYSGGSFPGPYAPGNDGPIYLSKPPGPIYEGPDSPYEFENPGKLSLGQGLSHSSSFSSHGEHHELHHGPQKPTIVVNAQGGAGSTGPGVSGSGIQQHVHHHYHHDNEGKAPTVVVNPIPINVPVPIAHGNGISSNEFTSSGYQGSASNGGFTPMGTNFGFTGKQTGINSGLGPVNGLSGSGIYGGGSNGQYSSSSNFQSNSQYSGALSKPVFEGPSSSGGLGNQGPASFGPSGSGSQNGFGQSGSGAVNSYGQSVSGGYNGNTNSFHSTNPDIYKKELSINGNKQSGANGLSQFSQYSQNNFNSNYDADKYQGLESSRQQQGLDCVCVAYEQCPAQDVIGRKDDLILPLDPRNLGKDIEALADDETVGNATVPVVRVTKEAVAEAKKDDGTVVEKDVKKVTKRDVSEKSSDEDQEQADGEARLLGLGALGGGVNGGKRIVPTFGVSFGLPYPSGGYPLNPYGSYPAQNPYFGAISPNGLNLGLLNVNPLVSFQVSKNEYGEKLVKPLVNLHVTPNENIINKVGSLFHSKKQGFNHHQGNINQHYHHHTHHSEPEYHHSPHYEHQPHYPQHSGPEYYPSAPQSGHYSHPPTAGGYGGGYSGGYGGGYGFPSGNGYYRDGSATGFNTPTELDYDPNNYYSRSANTSVQNNQGQSFQNPQNYNYQNVYPQNVNQFNPQQQFQQSQQQQPLQNNNYANNYQQYSNSQASVNSQTVGGGGKSIAFPTSRRRRDIDESLVNPNDNKSNDSNGTSLEINERSVNPEKRQFYAGNGRPPFNNNNYQQNQIQQCGPRQVCCRRPVRPVQQQNGRQCGTRNAQGINGRIKNPVYVDGDSEFGEYPWQAAILKKDPKESVYVCGGTLIDQQHLITAAHCIKSYNGFDLRVRLGEWDVNHDVEFYPYIERDIIQVVVHPEYYAGTLDNDIAILRLDRPVDFSTTPHISPACLPDKFSDFTGARCWTTGWGKDAFGDYGKYQNILKEVDVPIIGDQQCQQQLRQTRLGYSYKLNPGFICAGGEEGKDACKGDGGGPLVCERGNSWQLVGVVSWGIGCGQVNVPGVYVRVSYYLDWIQQVTHRV